MEVNYLQDYELGQVIETTIHFFFNRSNYLDQKKLFSIKSVTPNIFYWTKMNQL